MDITEHYIETERHKTFYLACGPEDGELIIMTHGWPELSLSWRHQLEYFGNKGYRAIAPDMRGYGRSTIYNDKDAYCQEQIVQDMAELLQSLKQEKAIWIGHDWGSPVAWNMALHHPNLTTAVASLCVPYGFGAHPKNMLDTVNRDTYPEEDYPAAQWDYMFFYYENFEKAQQEMDENPDSFVRLCFRKGDPAGAGLPSFNASIRKNNGWFEVMGGMPDVSMVPIDNDLISEEEADVYAKYLKKNTFFGPNAWYVNGDENEAFDRTKVDKKLKMPSLFIHATYDYVCDTLTTSWPEFMRENCTNLTEKQIDSGHWMSQEKPDELNKALDSWISSL